MDQPAAGGASPVEAKAPRIPRAYTPRRLTPADSVLIPVSRLELTQSRTSQNPLRTRPPVVDFDYPVASTSQIPLPPQTTPSSLPRRPEAFDQLVGRKRPNAGDPVALQKRPKSDGDVRAVADHYNARPNIDREARRESPIIALKSFNNWIKSVLIAKYGRSEGAQTPRVKVLELGCGKGGDLQKWTKAGTDEYIGIDLAIVSVEQARSRWQQLRQPRFRADFFALDCFEESIATLFTPAHIERPFDIVSMQFCLHYAFESESKARMMLENVTRYLRPGGVLLGTIPDAVNLLSRLAEIPEDQPSLQFGNEVYRVKFDTRDPTPRFGHRYTFFLQDAVEEVPEYVVYPEQFQALAAEYGLDMTYIADFQQIFTDEKSVPAFADLLQRMKVITADGDTELTPDQWEAANLYVGFVMVMRAPAE